MNFVFKPWQFALIVIAGWMHREQQQAIEYLRTENSVLREKLGRRRMLLSDCQRRRMVVKGRILGFKRLTEVGTLFTPDTILRWHRQLIANKWDHSNKRSQPPGRPRVRQVIVDLMLQFTQESPIHDFRRHLP